ncbi:MAG: allantoinase PuuE [Alphaproteobacteria bacterium]
MAGNEHLTRDFVGYGGRPPDPKWPDGAKLAVNFVLNYEEGSEPSIPDGDAESEIGLTEGGGPVPGRDLAAESMFEYGSRAGFWRLARLFDERALPATVFGCALALQRNPAAAAEIRRLGWDVCAHGWRWEKHPLLSEDQERARIARTVPAIEQLVGERPFGWYCRYGPSVNTRRLLVEAGGFLYDSDAYNDDLPYWTEVGGKPHLIVPYTLANNDTKFMRGAVAHGDDFFVYLRDAFDMLLAEGRAGSPKMMSVGLHLRIVGQPARAAGVARFLDHVKAHDDVWVTRRVDIARHWHQYHQP